ncbi:putative quinol monooxygenase [Sphingobium sp. TKS]|uniref:putative quinol monooxygenase n=1 Tax=Sphingobium sp. TKS TaxID=1315974 RepID=UPI00076FE6D1|nr:antibiotic biosynthesis monooxygenase [Sphingobium sp. TKS]AMK25601.1 antibiotic biosynthesis monooxygenase [Sphingobium sp. TKS]
MPIVISATMELNPDHAETILLSLAPVVEEVLADPDCQAYTWALDPFSPGRVQIFEQYTDTEALARHFAMPGVRGLRKLLEVAGPIKVVSTKYRVDHFEPVLDSTGKPRPDFFQAPQ